MRRGEEYKDRRPVAAGLDLIWSDPEPAAEGHILPDRAAQDLPRAVETIRSRGLEVPMITTELTSAADPAARPILSTAARLKIPFFKLGYWRYGNDVVADVQKALRTYGPWSSSPKNTASRRDFTITRGTSVWPAGMDVRLCKTRTRNG